MSKLELSRSARASVGPLALAALALAAPAPSRSAETRLLFEWTNHWELEMWPLYSSVSDFRVGPVTIVLDERGVGVSEPIVPALTSTVVLGPAITVAPASCQLGAITNPPVRLKVEVWNEDQVDIQFERLGDGSGAWQAVHCAIPGGPGAIMLGYANHQTIYDPKTLQPGVPALLPPSAENTPVFHARDEVRVTLNPCSPQRGNSGNGAVIFESRPPLGVRQWPLIENHGMERQLLSNRVTSATGRAGARHGYTFASFPDSPARTDPGLAPERAGSPRMSDRFGFVDSGGGVCLFLDYFALEFPEIEVWVASEYWEARHERCWYAATAQHEARHAQLFEDTFRAMQNRLAALVDDPSTFSPARPRYFPSQAEADRAIEQFRDRVKAILEEELRNLAARRTEAFD